MKKGTKKGDTKTILITLTQSSKITKEDLSKIGVRLESWGFTDVAVLGFATIAETAADDPAGKKWTGGVTEGA